MKIKKIMSLILIAITLAVMLTSCDNGENRLSSSGEIGADATGYILLNSWKDGARKQGDFDAVDKITYDKMKETLSQGDRFMEVLVRVEDIKELRGKPLEKTTFTIEADRKVTLTIHLECDDLSGIEKDYNKTIMLEPNKSQSIEMNITDEFKINRATVVRIYFWQNDNDGFPWSYGTNAFAEWSQTIYKITDFKIFCD